MKHELSLHLSRLLLSPDSPRTMAELLSPYEMHRTVMSGFPPNLVGERVLFRLEWHRALQVPQVLVQSRSDPDWGPLRKQPGHLLPTPAAVSHKRVCLALEDGMRLAFRMRANPTRRASQRRHAWTEEQDQLHWLERKGEWSGFTLERVSVWDEGTMKCQKPCAQGARPLCFRSVLFEGVLRVTAAGALLEGLSRGIGSAKAFGFGLLSLAPVGAMVTTTNDGFSCATGGESEKRQSPGPA